MTTTATTISKVHEAILKSFDNTQVSSELLLDLLAEAEDQTPNLFVDYTVDSVSRVIDPVQLNWTGDYFSLQKMFAEHNFSRERLEHLIEVRELFRQRRYLGFAPSIATTDPANTHIEQVQDKLSPYHPSTNLKQFVDEGDLLTVRTALRLELNDNRLDGHDLRAALAWVKSNTSGLCEDYVEKAFAREIDLDSSRWTPEYYGAQIVYLKTNFAEERFLHIIEVRALLRERGEESFAPIAASDPKTATSQPSPKVLSSQSQRTTPPSYELNPIFKTALLIGGAIAAVVVFLLALVK